MSPCQATISRRNFLKVGLTAGALGGCGNLTHFNALSSASYKDSIVLEEILIQSPKVPEHFSGYRIGYISDIHLGLWISPEIFTHALQLIQNANVDLLILGGDYICVPETKIWQQLHLIRNEEPLKMKAELRIPFLFKRTLELCSDFSFRDGIVAIAGNHEHWNSTAAFTSLFYSSSHVKLLLNEHHSITREQSSLLLYGTDDYLTGRPRLPDWQTVTNQKNAFSILLSHNPDLVAYAMLRRVPKISFDLALCGHTHGGQLRLPGGIALTYQLDNSLFAEGYHEFNGSRIYTSRGLGVVGVPFRVNCPPEVTVLELQSV